MLRNVKAAGGSSTRSDAAAAMSVVTLLLLGVAPASQPSVESEGQEGRGAPLPNDDELSFKVRTARPVIQRRS